MTFGGTHATRDAGQARAGQGRAGQGRAGQASAGVMLEDRGCARYARRLGERHSP